MDEKIYFGQRLLELRKNYKKSQSEIAQLLGITTSAYQNYENGRREAGYATIAKLADFYGVTTDYLLGREEKPNPLAMLNVALDEDEFIEIYKQLPQFEKEILADTISKFAQATRQAKIKKMPAPLSEQGSETAEELAPNTDKRQRHSMRTGDLVTDEQAKEKEAT